ncbi:37826_t:CDS:2 [Gigaspora margarita]|uniref:37826_t:CDS:1 n=1 Tax=Gigaspora margarita TaxID=4874 RepID=A0ABM8W191_GIGMA|nr:37826_t:CDS:2 [Gigaspora margarita]
MAEENLSQQLTEHLQLSEPSSTSTSTRGISEYVVTTKECHKVLVTRELLLFILCAMPVRLVLKMRLVCRLWETILQDDHTWKQIYESKFGKVDHPLLLEDQTYKSICIFKEYHEARLWSNSSITTLNESSQSLTRYKLFGDYALSNQYMYDILAIDVNECGIAVALVSQKRLVLDEEAIGGIRVVDERPTISNVDFTLVPNVEIKVYVKMIPFGNNNDKFDYYSCDIQRVTVSQNDLTRDANWVKNIVRIQFAHDLFMYSSDISLGTCKIFSLYKSLGNFNVRNPPLKELATSFNFLVAGTEPGNFQLSTRASVYKHMATSLDLDERYKFDIIIPDVEVISQRIYTPTLIQEVIKGKVTAFHMEQNDFMIVGYFNNEEEATLRAWDLRKIRHLESFESQEFRKDIVQYVAKLPAKAQSFSVRWKNSSGEIQTLSITEQEKQLQVSPEIIVTCSGGHVLIFVPDTTILKSDNDKEPTQKLNMIWEVRTGLTSCRLIDTRYWLQCNYPSNGNWIFISAKQTKGDMKVPVVVQFCLTETSNTGSCYGYLEIDEYNPNKEEIKPPNPYIRLVHRTFTQKIPHSATIIQAMPYLPHYFLIVYQRREPDVIRPRPRFNLIVYDYHNTNHVNINIQSSPLCFMVPSGYIMMATDGFKDDIVYIPFPNLKSRGRLSRVNSTNPKQNRPKLQPDGANRIKVNRGPGGKRIKQPKGTKIDKRKHSSKIQYSKDLVKLTN